MVDEKGILTKRNKKSAVLTDFELIKEYIKYKNQDDNFNARLLSFFIHKI